VAALVGAALVAGCGGGSEGPGASGGPDDVNVPPPATDAGTPPPPVDAGTPQVDAGTPPDGGAPPDAGTPTDGGTPPPVGKPSVTLPTLQGWTFYGSEQGAPREVYGVSEDQGGNVWVAGGEDGLYLLRKGAARFERFTMADGLRPYGYMPDGADPEGDSRHFKVISVAGGPAGTVFVGYQGHPLCENNWDVTPVPSIYKSGDADRVTLTASGIKVVHYDIFSGPGMIPSYKWDRRVTVQGHTYEFGDPKARERDCSVVRIAYDPAREAVWFGGNHGVSLGDPTFKGAPSCNGDWDCSGVLEHVHPHFGAVVGGRMENGRWVGGSTAEFTANYYGLSVTQEGDLWLGGAGRAALLRYMTSGYGTRNFFGAGELIEQGQFDENRIDVWKDAVPEKDAAGNDLFPNDSQRTDDAISGMAAMADGTAWVSSYANGLAHIDASGRVLSKMLTSKAERNLSALVRDPNGGLWVGNRWEGAVSRVQGGSVTRSDPAAWGGLFYYPVWDLQVGRSGEGRRILAAFLAGPKGEGGVVGIYTGP
jgi:hypothetical protein